MSKFVLLVLAFVCLAVHAAKLPNNFEVEHVPSTENSIKINFTVSDGSAVEFPDAVSLAQNYQESGAGFTYEYGKPILPAVTRIVVVPPSAGLKLVIHAAEPQYLQVNSPPAVCDDEEAVNQLIQPHDIERFYPPVLAEMSSPIVIRGVRMVSVTTYPVRYNKADDAYLLYENIQVDIIFTDSEPLNPARTPIRRHRSTEFLKFIHSLVLNPDQIGRDDPDRDHDPEYLGHYLIVANDNCLPYAVPFIEWRRKSGWKVDIISLSNDDQADNTNLIKGRIQDLYDSYLDDGIDPFDQILLIGDLSSYVNLQPAANWVLASSGHHYDWFYALLEGDDNDADVGISRWCAGSRPMVELFTLRTLAYEAEPYMDNPGWLTRAAVYAQYWGRNWHVSLATNVRWGTQVLKSIGFDDVRSYENITQWDGNGQQVGPFIRTQYNDGVSVMIGRAENYFFRGQLPGVNDNVVFPIDMYLGGHQEYSVWTLLRTGTPDHPKGPVAVTCGWGNPNTFSMSNIWLEQVNGFLQHDLTFGWARLKAIIGPRAYIPNYEGTIGRYRVDIMYYGDPGIQYWKGIPLTVEAEHPLNIATDTRSVIVKVTDDDNNIVENAQVTFYVPGDMPAADDDEYAEYSGMLMKTTTSNSAGVAEFIFDEIEFAGDEAFVTVTGREILPYFGEIDIRQNISAIELTNYVLSEVEGNEDDIINPDETFTLDLTALNRSDRNDIEDVTAIVTSASPWIDIEENEISFGDIEAEAEAEGNQSVTLIIHPSCPDGTSRPKTKPIINVEFHSGDLRWYSLIELTPSAPNYVVHRIVGDQITTRPRIFDVYLDNIGGMDAPETNARLLSLENGIRVIIDEAQYPAIRSGRYWRIRGDRFRITGTQDAVPGAWYNMLIILNNEQGFIDTVFFDLQVDEPRDDSPQGPDGFGYICYDDTDDDWDVAPIYNWKEISLHERNRNVNGVLIDFEGRSPLNIGESIVIDLPFETQFYGEIYDQITVSTNGFIAMGDQEEITNFQNWPMDRAMGGGVGMLAPLWDDLQIADNGGIYYYYDEDTFSFIVEWYKMRHQVGGNVDLIFQVIIYDHEVWETETGDQRIIFQYKQVRDIRGRGNDWIDSAPYASIGISSPDGTTGLNYSYNDIQPVTSAPISNQRVLLFTNSPIHSVGIIMGRVTDLETREPLSDVSIVTQHGFKAESDDEGYWVIDDALAEIDFYLTFYKQGFNDSVIVDLVFDEGDTLEFNIALLHPEAIPTIEDVDIDLESGTSLEIEFDINNPGNGSLTWYAENVVTSEEGFEPWDYRGGINVGQILEQSLVKGVVFIDEHFYISVGNDRSPIICIFDRDGEFSGEFDQPEDGNNGMSDLAYDGELIWGIIGNRVYGFTTEGEVVYNWETPRSKTAITWDSERELFWLASTVSNPVAYSADGELQEDMELNRYGLRIYGLAFLAEDLDRYQLYVFNFDNDNDFQAIHKYNIETGDTLGVTTLNPENGGRSRGAFISYTYSNYSTVLITISSASNDDGGDRIDLWQIDARRDWIDLDPTSGIIEAGDAEHFTLTLDASALPMDEFSADIVFHHNASGGETVIPVSLNVLLGDRNISLDLRSGWNQVSINVEPDELGIVELLQPLVEADALILVKDGQGRFYHPENNFDGIGEWNTEDGYQMFLTSPMGLGISGRIIPTDRPLELAEGWNLKAYYPWHPVDPVTALTGIVDRLIIVKNGHGNFYLPAFNYSNMEAMIEGKGYQFKMIEAAELIYRLNDGERILEAKFDQPEYYKNAVIAEYNMSILIFANPAAAAGSELGVFDQAGTLIGSGCFDSEGRCGLAAYGEVEFSDFLSFKQWKDGVETDVIVEPIEGSLRWTPNGIVIGSIGGSSASPVEFGINKIFPNPANGPVQIEFGLKAAGHVRMVVYDLSGRRIETILNSYTASGSHRQSWDTSLVPSGIFIVKLQTEEQEMTAKFAIVK